MDITEETAQLALPVVVLDKVLQPENLEKPKVNCTLAAAVAVVIWITLLVLAVWAALVAAELVAG